MSVQIHVRSIGCYSAAFELEALENGRVSYTFTSELETPVTVNIVDGSYQSTVQHDSRLLEQHQRWRVIVTGLKSNHPYQLYTMIERDSGRQLGQMKTVRTDALTKTDPKIRLGPIDRSWLEVRMTTDSVGRTTSQVAEIAKTEELDGTGITVGVFEVDYPRPSHPEFLKDDDSSRISFGDLTAGEVDTIDFDDAKYNHATHVCGVIGAKGVNKCAEGIAPACQLKLFNTADYLDEIADELDTVSVTNHSYGLVLGWSSKTIEIDGELVTYDLWVGDLSVVIANEAESDEEKHDDPTDFGGYTATSKTIDTVFYRRPTTLSVWSAGNDRDDNYLNIASQDKYLSVTDDDGILGLFLLDATVYPPPSADGRAGGFETIGPLISCKNTVSVGSAENFSARVRNQIHHYHVNLSSFSSFGPTDTGRVKPDLIAVGEELVGPVSYLADTELADRYAPMSGTSVSAPVVSGLAALLIQQFKRIFHATPSATTLKAILVHTAISAEIGPSYESGWGLVDGQTAITTVKNSRHSTEIDPEEVYTMRSRPLLFTDLSYSGTRKTINFKAEGYPKDLTFTVVWPDPPSDDGSLINRLQFKVTDTAGKVYHPWKLDPTKPGQPAVRAENQVDNVQQIRFLYPDPTKTYTLTVDHYGDDGIRELDDDDELVIGSQKYSLIVTAHHYTIVAVYRYFIDIFYYLKGVLTDFWNTQCLGLKSTLLALATYTLNLMEGLEDVLENNL